MNITFTCSAVATGKFDKGGRKWGIGSTLTTQDLTVQAPKQTYIFSRLISIHFLREIVERI